MTLQQLKYIIKIAECSSLNEAAEKLYISQPSLSAAIKEIENEFHINLFIRTTKGVTLTFQGVEFLAYARDIVEREERMYSRFNRGKTKGTFTVSAHHYAFCVTAFANIIKKLPSNEYEFSLRENKTFEILQDVYDFRSELGIIYKSEYNSRSIDKYLTDFHLEFIPIFECLPHVFLSSKHPLKDKKEIYIEELNDYPFLAFEQGKYNSFYFSEEILSEIPRKKTIYVTDRATLFNLIDKLDGYTISSGFIHSDLNGDNIVARKLVSSQKMTIGYIKKKKLSMTDVAKMYIDEIKSLVLEYGVEII